MHICVCMFVYVCVCICVLSHFSHVCLCVTLWTVACQAPLSVGFPRQEYWSGLPCPPPRDLPNPRIKPASPALQVNSLPAEPPGKPKLFMNKLNHFAVYQELTQHCKPTILQLKIKRVLNNDYHRQVKEARKRILGEKKNRQTFRG